MDSRIENWTDPIDQFKSLIIVCDVVESKASQDSWLMSWWYLGCSKELHRNAFEVAARSLIFMRCCVKACHDFGAMQWPSTQVRKHHKTVWQTTIPHTSHSHTGDSFINNRRLYRSTPAVTASFSARFQHNGSNKVATIRWVTGLIKGEIRCDKWIDYNLLICQNLFPHIRLILLGSPS